MIKIIVFATITSLSISGNLSYAQTQNPSNSVKTSSQNKINPNKPNKAQPPKKPTYKDNSGIDESKLISREVAIGELKDGATLIKAERKSWKDYQKGTNGIFHDINGNRQIWEVEVNFPCVSRFWNGLLQARCESQKNS